MPRTKVYIYRVLESSFILDNKSLFAKLLFGTANVEDDPKHFISFDTRGYIIYKRLSPSNENFPSSVPLRISENQAIKIASDYINRINISVDSVKAFKEKKITQLFHKAQRTIIKQNNQWHITYVPIVRGSDDDVDREVPIKSAFYKLVIGHKGLEAFEYNMRPILSFYTLKPIDLELDKSTFSTLPLFISTIKIIYELDGNSSTNEILPYFFISPLVPSIPASEPPDFKTALATSLSFFDSKNRTGRLIPDEWLPNVEIHRIVLHWAVSTYVADDTTTSFKNYHFVVDGDGKLVKYNDINKNAPVMTGYAAHVKNLNSNSIGLSVACMSGASKSNRIIGNYPLKQLQWDIMAQVAAELSDYYKIPVSRATILCHGEVKPTLKVDQEGKWDMGVLPWDVEAAEKIGDEKERKKALDKIWSDNNNLITVGDRMRDLIRGYKNNNGFPIVDSGYMLEIVIFEKTLICIQNGTSIYVRVDDLKTAFSSPNSHVYSKSESNTKNQVYHLDLIKIDSKDIKDLKAIRLNNSSDLFIDCAEIAEKLGLLLTTFNFVKKAYVISR